MSEENQKDNKPSALEYLKLLPQFGWLIGAGLLIYFLLGPIVRILERNTISKVGVAGITVELVQLQIEKAAKAKGQGFPLALKDRVARAPEGMFDDVAIMWVDDTPNENSNSSARRALSSTEEAIELITHGKYAILITDQNRKTEKNAAVCFPGNGRGQPLDERKEPVANAGCYFVQQAKKVFDGKKAPMPPIIIYTSREYPDWGVPTYAFGITTQVDQLFHLILDALERRQRSIIGALPPYAGTSYDDRL
jgi:hypothetical protein